MQTLQVGAGFAAVWTVTLRDDNGSPVVGYYDGSEDLDLVVSALDGTEETVTDSLVQWIDPTVPTVLLKLGATDTAAWDPGPRSVSIGLTIQGLRVECYRAALRLTGRP